MHRLDRVAPLRALRPPRAPHPFQGLRLLRVVRPMRVLALLLAVAVLPLAAEGAAAAATTTYTSNCGVNIRARASTASSIRMAIKVDTVLTVSGKVSGGSWSASCKTWVHGNSWFTVTAINGRSVRSLFGVSVVYAATGLFRLSSSGYLEGIDVSNWQGRIDFTKVKAAGKQFVFAKASEGTSWTDASYARNKASAIAAGLRFGAYHFARPGNAAGDGVREADHFIAVMGLKRGMLRPVLDLEATGGLGVVALQSWVRSFLGRIYSRLGVRAMIYTTASFWASYMGSTTWFASNGYPVLFIAQWKVASPSLPASRWAGHGWTFWQYSSCGSVAGIRGCVDLDRFKGSDLSDLLY
ncbi:MAG TPA: glycoside hydrolase family 25 protein [Candidatus Limnocylindrales bacterium]